LNKYSNNGHPNLRSWPENAVPVFDQPPAIASQIELKVVDLSTFTISSTSLLGHRGFTPSEKAFYLYLDVSHNLVGSGSEDCQGYIWDRQYKCLVAKLPHTACVNRYVSIVLFEKYFVVSFYFCHWRC
jgi:hypothetical protein